MSANETTDETKKAPPSISEGHKELDWVFRC